LERWEVLRSYSLWAWCDTVVSIRTFRLQFVAQCSLVDRYQSFRAISSIFRVIQTAECLIPVSFCTAVGWLSSFSLHFAFLPKHLPSFWNSFSSLCSVFVPVNWWNKCLS
jgi:hypothetical protein